MREVTIAIDAMGGDHGPHVTVKAALDFLQQHHDVNIVLVGLREVIEAELKSLKAESGSRLRIHHASEVVTMDDPLTIALRGKKDSSMRLTAELIKRGEADAGVSAGNTGALMAVSRFVLKTLPGIERPAIATPLPNRNGGWTYVLDLGANVDCTAEHLCQFGVMGAALVTAVEHKEQPTVGLLNIGEEDIKGHRNVREAHALLAASPINYVGFVEGDDIFSGKVDVVVTDGFTGNVALKTMEGVARLISGRLHTEFRAGARERVAGWLARPVLERVARAIDPRRYNGACMVGLAAVVVKSHGRADSLAFARAIELAALAVRRGLIRHIAEAFEERKS